jgi:hypothetical protein
MKKERRRHGDAVATDGSRLYVSVQQPGETQRNFGDMSEQGREQCGQSIALTQQQRKVHAARVARHCSFVGISNPMLHHYHPCKTCKAGVHNLCAQEFGLKEGTRTAAFSTAVFLVSVTHHKILSWKKFQSLGQAYKTPTRGTRLVGGG